MFTAARIGALCSALGAEARVTSPSTVSPNPAKWLGLGAPFGATVWRAFLLCWVVASNQIAREAIG